MTTEAQITEGELALILEALDDAAYYRDSRARVLKTAVKRRTRRLPQSETPGTSTIQQGTATDNHRRKAQAYEALALKLRRSSR